VKCSIVSESASPEANAKLFSEASSVAGRLSHNEEERYIAVMKELQFGELLMTIESFSCSYARCIC